jgi:hypothetical protein
MSMVLHQADSEFSCGKGNQGAFGPPCIISFFSLHEKLAFLTIHLRIRDDSSLIMISQFASDFDIAEVISDGNLDEDA